LALREKAEIFWLNKREYCIIKSPVFGNVVMIEVGATMVGSMIQTYQGTNVKKGKKKVILNLAVRQLSCYLRKTKLKSIMIYWLIPRKILKRS
jgi:phosphatidylserine decarboxylase